MKPHRFSILAKFFFFVKKYYLFLISGFLVLSLVFAFGMIVGGKLLQRPALTIEKDLLINLEEQPIVGDSKKDSSQENGYVASSRGKYYYPVDCSLAKNLSEKNKIYFQSREEAEARGYIYNSRCD